MTRHPLALAILLTLVAAPALPGCDRTASLSAQERIQRAKDSEARGDIRAGIIELKNAVQQEPDNPEARWLLGLLYLKAELGPEAEKELRQAGALGMGSVALAAPLAESLLLQGEYQRVLDETHPTGGESASNKARILRLRGNALASLGKLDEGCELYQSALDLDANHVPAYWGLANCAYAKGDADGARAYIQSALKIEPDNADTWVLLGDLERVTDNRQAAEAAYSNALKHDPGKVSALFNRAGMTLSAGNRAEAQQDLDAIRRVAPRHFLGDYLQAVLLHADGKTDAALDSLTLALKKRPNFVTAYPLLASLQYNKRQYGQAAKTLAHYLRLFPGNLDARKLLAAAQLKLEAPEQALTLLRPVLSVATDDPQLLALAAEAYMMLKDPGTATSLFERASDLAPANYTLDTQLALSRMASGDTARAIADLERASAAETGGEQSGFILALHHMRNKEPDRALEVLSGLEQKLPDSPSLHNMKGVAYGSKNDLANARKSFERALALAPDYFSAAHNLAQLDLAENRPADARGRYEALLAQDKQNVRAMVALAQLAEHTGKPGEYLGWLEKAAKADPKAILPRQLLARHYVEQNQPDKALVLAREVLTANPDAPAALSLLGKTQLSAGESENAASSFTRLAALNPGSADAHYHLGLAQRNLRRTDAARAAFRQALEKQPGHLAAQEALVALESAAGRTDDALRIAAAVQSQRPQSPAGFTMEGDVHLAAKNYAKAHQAYARAATLGPGSAITIKQHRALTLGGNEKAADALADKWLKAHPDDLLVLTYLSRHDLVAGRYPEAIARHESLQEKAPRDAGVLNNLAWLYQQTDDPRARKTAERALSLAPESAAIQDTLGWILVRQGETAKGRDLLAKAAAQTDHPGVHYRYAAALAKSGDKRSALAELDKLLQSPRPFDEKEQAIALKKSLR